MGCFGSSKAHHHQQQQQLLVPLLQSNCFLLRYWLTNSFRQGANVTTNDLAPHKFLKCSWTRGFPFGRRLNKSKKPLVDTWSCNHFFGGVIYLPVFKNYFLHTDYDIDIHILYITYFFIYFGGQKTVAVQCATVFFVLENLRILQAALVQVAPAPCPSSNCTYPPLLLPCLGEKHLSNRCETDFLPQLFVLAKL